MTLGFRYDDVGAVDHPHYARYATITPGAPGRCPECDAFGYIDHADVPGQVQSQHCRPCGVCWEYRFDADGRILEVRELPAAGERSGTRVTYGRRATDAVLDLRAPRKPRSPSPEPRHQPASRR